MERDALIFMLLAWGFTLGLLTFCVVMLAKHPQVVSVLTGDPGENNGNNGESGESAPPDTEG